VIARVERSADINYGGKYADVYLGDMFTKDRFTFNLGRALRPPDGHQP
jgi:hypothetical protein